LAHRGIIGEHSAALRTLGAVTVFDRFHFVFARFRALLAPVTDAVNILQDCGLSNTYFVRYGWKKNPEKIP
jgi:hypothetical protein